MAFDGKSGWISQFNVRCSLGNSVEEVAHNLFSGTGSSLTASDQFSTNKQYLGMLDISGVDSLPENFKSRNNALLMSLIEPLNTEIEACIGRYGRHRVGVVLGTSTTGIGTSETHLRQLSENSELPSDYTYRHQEISNPVELLCQHYGLSGPAYAISTACTSGAKALASARRLIASGVCDVVICGGVDTLCEMTVNGFSALGAVSSEPTIPFDENRNGINLGEGGAVFVMTRHSGPYRLMGAGESSDAHHISAPDPTGQGAFLALNQALEKSGVRPCDIHYVNLHGTGTEQNDAMEAKAIERVLGLHVPCSSTKTFTGHTLGAAGAVEAAFCLLALTHQKIPGQNRLEKFDPVLPKINLQLNSEPANIKYCMSNSFAFGGNNIALIMGLNGDSYD